MAKYKTYRRVVLRNWRTSAQSVNYFNSYVSNEEIIAYFEGTDESILFCTTESMEPSKAQPLINIEVSYPRD